MKFKGIMPALITPLNEDETLNVSALRLLLEKLLAEGADGFYIAGATGEGLVLRPEVRMELAARAVEIVGGRKPCIVHIASMNFAEAVELARHAEQAGASGLSAVPPFYFKYDHNAIFQYYEKLAGATHLPMMIYNTPAVGSLMGAELAARLFEIENVTAIKWTSPQYDEMIRLRDLTHGEMNIINGPDEMLLMGLSAGADGGIGTTYNFMLPTVKEIYTCFQNGDIRGAQAAQTRLDRVIAVLLRMPSIAAAKAVLEAMGIPAGNAVFPQKRFSPAEKKEVLRKMAEAGVVF